MDKPVAMLEMRGVMKSFGSVQALDRVDFSVRAGTVHALCGENGAGKSTLMKILAGVHLPDAGEIRVAGKPLRCGSPRDSITAGISMLYQELDLAPDMTVYENVYLGREHCKGWSHRLDRKSMMTALSKRCEDYGFDLPVDATVNLLTTGQCQLVELLKALERQSRVIVMDEPTSSLSLHESELLFAIIKRLRADGISIVYISHRMDEVMALADDITVLRDGKVVHTDRADRLSVGAVVKHMVGRELDQYFPPRSVELQDAGLEVCDLPSPLKPGGHLSFKVRRGEVVGMAGLVGSGRSEILDSLFGVEPVRKAEVRLDGKLLQIKHPDDAIREGMAYLTEDRKRTGLCAGLAGQLNMLLPVYKHHEALRGLQVSSGRERGLSEEGAGKTGVKWASPDDLINHLSGGNQQKVLFARWLLLKAEIYLLDEPTRGIDVGAKQEVYRLINQMAEAGKVVLMVSSDLPELFGVCDRLLVMRGGELVGDLDVRETTPEAVMRLAALEDNHA